MIIMNSNFVFCLARDPDRLFLGFLLLLGFLFFYQGKPFIDLNSPNLDVASRNFDLTDSNFDVVSRNFDVTNCIILILTSCTYPKYLTP